MDTQKDGHRYTLSVAHQDLPAILKALRTAAERAGNRGNHETARVYSEVRDDLITQRDAQPWVAAGQPSRDEG